MPHLTLTDTGSTDGAAHTSRDVSARRVDPAVPATLQGILTDLLELTLTAKHAHWNVTGPRFRGLHLQLDELAAAARDVADTVAERCAALGVAPDGRPEALTGGRGFPTGPIPDVAVVEHLLEQIESLIERATTAIEGDLASDLVSQSAVIDVAAELDKQAWMLAAQR